MTATIPASLIVKINPSVLNAGGSALVMNGMMLSSSWRVPVGTFQSFPTAVSVANYFGPTSIEATDSAIYFSGFSIGQQTPSALLVTQYPTASVPAYLRGGNISALPLTTLQSYVGTLTISFNGSPVNSSTINLGTATSFSAAAQLITTGFSGVVGATQASITASIGAIFVGSGSSTNLTVASVSAGVIHAGDTITGTGISGNVTVVSQTSGSTGGVGVYVVSGAITSSTATITATSTTMDVSAVSSGTLAVGLQITGAGVAAGTYITALGSGTGGVGTYILTSAQEVGSESMSAVTPTCTWDSVSGAFVIASNTSGVASTIGFPTTSTFSTNLLLTAATGAVISQGAVAGVPATFMPALVALTQNWCTFFTAFNPDASGNANKLLFAEWNNAQNNRFIYAVDDKDITPTLSTNATTSLGNILDAGDYSGTIPLYEPADYHLASFVAGFIASVDFGQKNGRATLAFKGQQGLGISVTDATVATNLIANGYNFYGAWATANQQFLFMYPGSITGVFEWTDTYYGQVYLNQQLQLALVNLLTQINAIPYNQRGYALMRAAAQDPINQAISFGTIVPGIQLSQQQAATIQSTAPKGAAAIIQNVGYYLQILNPTPQIRQARGTPQCTLWYADGGSVQSISLASIVIQ